MFQAIDQGDIVVAAKPYDFFAADIVFAVDNFLPVGMQIDEQRNIFFTGVTVKRPETRIESIVVLYGIVGYFPLFCENSRDKILSHLVHGRQGLFRRKVRMNVDCFSEIHDVVRIVTAYYQENHTGIEIAVFFHVGKTVVGTPIFAANIQTPDIVFRILSVKNTFDDSGSQGIMIGLHSSVQYRIAESQNPDTVGKLQFVASHRVFVVAYVFSESVSVLIRLRNIFKFVAFAHQHEVAKPPAVLKIYLQYDYQNSY
jgi:hypothetical protein